MKVIRKLQATVIRDITLDAVREALESEGLEVEASGMIWATAGVRLTLNITLPGETEVAIQRQKHKARKLCSKFGLPSDTFAREFYLSIKQQNEVRVKVVDIRPRNHKYPIIVEVFDHSNRLHGKRFKCSLNHVMKALGTK